MVTGGHVRSIPKNPFVCPKKGIGPSTFLFFSDGIEARNILFDREGSGSLGYIVWGPTQTCIYLIPMFCKIKVDPNTPVHNVSKRCVRWTCFTRMLEGFSTKKWPCQMSLLGP